MLAMSPNKNSSKTKFLLKFSLNKTAQDIKKYATDMILKYPTLKDMIIDLYKLCMAEI